MRCRVSIAALVLLVACAAGARADTVTGQLKIYLLNIGQGDAILIVCPHGTHRLLIDSGAGKYQGSQQAFQDAMRELLPGSNQTIDVAVASHPHEDHVAGFAWVLDTFRVKKFIDNGKPYTTTYNKIRTRVDQLVNSGQLLYFRADKFPPSSIVDFCPASNVGARLLVPKGFGKASNVNNNSVAVVVRYNDLKFLFTGDAEKLEEKLLLADPEVAAQLAGATFYKAGHHGAETSSTAPLLDSIHLEWVGASAGCKGVSPNDGYRHPRAATLNAFLSRITQDADKEKRTIPAGETTPGKWTTVQLHRRIYETAADGTLLFVSDGSTIDRAPVTLAHAIAKCGA